MEASEWMNDRLKGVGVNRVLRRNQMRCDGRVTEGVWFVLKGLAW